MRVFNSHYYYDVKEYNTIGQFMKTGAKFVYNLYLILIPPFYILDNQTTSMYTHGIERKVTLIRLYPNITEFFILQIAK